MRRVVVTGLGAISPCGMTATASWNAVLEKESAVRPIVGGDVSPQCRAPYVGGGIMP